MPFVRSFRGAKLACKQARDSPIARLAVAPGSFACVLYTSWTERKRRREEECVELSVGRSACRSYVQTPPFSSAAIASCANNAPRWARQSHSQSYMEGGGRLQRAHLYLPSTVSVRRPGAERTRTDGQPTTPRRGSTWLSAAHFINILWVSAPFREKPGH